MYDMYRYLHPVWRRIPTHSGLDKNPPHDLIGDSSREFW
jgi:hypothetical protein